MFEHFIDLTYAYRFGPPAYDVAVVRLLAAGTEQVLSEDFFFPTGPALPCVDDLGLRAALQLQNEQHRIRLTTEQFAHAVAVEVPGYVPDDSYFSLAPGTEKWVSLTPERTERPRPPRGVVRALNAQSAVRIVPA
jgi:beta-mannosidase